MTGAAGYRPILGPPVSWPNDWGQRFAIFVDVEEEFDWSAPFSREARATSAIPELLPFAERLAARGIGATYLIDHPVATHTAAVAVMRAIAALPNTAIGTQLHPWVNPPFEEPLSAGTSFVGNLPEPLEAAKLDILTAAIEEGVGVRPLAFRAGRYGVGPNTWRLLAERGYRLDTSVRPGFDYRSEGGPDFRMIGDAARWLAGDLFELPLTTVFTGHLRRTPLLYDLADRLPHGRGLLARSGLLARVPLTPEGVPVADALEAIRRAASDGAAILNLSFHSPSLVPGHTPYVRDATDLTRFHAWWDAVFALLDRLEIRSASLADMLAACGTGGASATAA